MANVLDGAGLEPAPEEVTEPVVPEAPEAPEPEPVVEDEIVVPEGANNPDAVQSAIKAERAKAREANARARDLERQLQERNDADKPLEQRASEATERAEKAELRAMRIEVAAESGLAISLATRLAGSTRDELEKDAKTLLLEFGAAAVKPVGIDGGFKPSPARQADPASDHNGLLAAIIAAHKQG